jgi:hypothetical protein
MCVQRIMIKKIDIILFFAAFDLPSPTPILTSVSEHNNILYCMPLCKNYLKQTGMIVRRSCHNFVIKAASTAASSSDRHGTNAERNTQIILTLPPDNGSSNYLSIAGNDP